MITGFDHAMIAVRDLDAASDSYRALGFNVVPGGRHPTRGTHNTLIRFGWEFLELIAIHDPEERARLGAEGEGLTNFLKAREGGFVDLILGTDGIEEVARRTADAGLDVGGLINLSRVRPDGLATANRVLPIGPMSSRHIYPGFIQWETSDPERLSGEGSDHPLGTLRLVGLSIIVADLDRGRQIYTGAMALPAPREDEVAELGARRLRYVVGPQSIDLLAPSGPGPVTDALAALGEGLFEVHFAGADLAEAKARVAAIGATLQPAPGVPGGWLLPEDHTAGARLILIE